MDLKKLKNMNDNYFYKFINGVTPEQFINLSKNLQNRFLKIKYKNDMIEIIKEKKIMQKRNL